MTRGRVAVGIAVFAALCGCKWGAYDEDEFDRAFPLARATAIAPAAVRAWGDALGRHCGGTCRARRVVVSGRNVSADVTPAGKPRELDDLSFLDGDLSSKRPVSLTDAERAALDKELFDVTRPLLDKLPELARTAVQRAQVDAGAFRSLSIDRRRGVVEIGVRVEGPRAGRTLVWNADSGQLLRVE